MKDSAKRLLFSFSELDGMFLEEAETAEFETERKRKRIAKYGALATAAALGIAVTYKFIRAKRAAA